MDKWFAERWATVGHRTLAALAVWFLASTAPVTAQKTSRTIPVDADKYWKTQCLGPGRVSETLVCTANQTILTSKSGKLVFSIKVVALANIQSMVMELQGPLNVYLPDGYALSVDGTDLVKTDISNCNQSGCFAALKLTDTQVAALKKGTTLRISFSMPPRSARYVETPLAGFTRAMQAIK